MAVAQFVYPFRASPPLGVNGRIPVCHKILLIYRALYLWEEEMLERSRDRH